MDLKAISQLIKERRSTFTPMFTGDRIDDDIINQILENANWAPTHRKTEPWRFYVICDDAKLRLSEYQRDYYISNTPHEKQNDIKLRKTVNNALKSSHIIALVLHRDPEERIPEWEELAALSCAVQNMWLSVTAAELGCYWSTPKSALEATSFLNLKEDEKCYGWFYIGIPQQGLNQKSERGDVSEKVNWIRK